MATELETAQAMVTAYRTAEQEILLGKEVRMGGPGLDRWLRYEDLEQVRAGRKEWEATVAKLQTSDAGAPQFGGLAYSLSDFSSPR